LLNAADLARALYKGIAMKYALLTCLALAWVSPLWAAPGDLTSQVDQVFAELNRPDSPGCALAVVRDGAIVYSKGYGMASLEHAVRITPQTVFDIGSTSKQITAASILLLAQDGKLSIDDDVRKFIPEIPDYGTPVTLRHLLHHTSGIRDYIALLTLGGINVEDVATDDDALRAIARQKSLDFKPGDEHSYSNSGYFLLSLVVKRASGKTLREFAQKRIFGPLGMTSTQFFDDHTLVIPRRASSYEPHPDGGFRASIANWEQTGDGAVQTTVEDLAKWDQNFYDPKVGEARLIEELQTSGALNGGEKIPYARGLFVGEYRGLRRVAHGGAWAGFRAEMVRFPDERFSVITLCNLGSADSSGLAGQVADLYLADKLKPAEEAATPAASVSPAPAAAVDVSRYPGLYFDSNTGTFRRVHAKEGKLFFERGPGNETELAPIGDGRFLMLNVPVRVEVHFSPREMRVLLPDVKPLLFQAVEPATLSAADLSRYAGMFFSEELDATFTMAVEDGKLVLKAKRQPPVPLEPAFADAFRAPGVGLIRFSRNPEKKITGFEVGVGRARHMSFTRIESR
jgi:CubicO group peptidase (beta-lactamase class C family)